MTYTAESERDCAEISLLRIINELEKSNLMRCIDTIHK